MITQTNKKLVIILGRGRCGTSMAAGILNKLGVDIRGRVENIKVAGYGEIVYDKNLNFLFEFADKARKNSLEYPCEELEKKLRKVSEERGLIWGWKESSIAELGLARPLLSWILRVCSNVYCVFCHRRDKEAHAKSISKGLWSGKTSMEWCRNSIKEQEEVIEEFLRKFKIPRLDIYFEDFFTTPEQEVRKIADFLEVPYTSEAKDFIKLDMKHF